MKFLLVVFPDGRLMLSTKGNVPPDELSNVYRAFDLWKDDPRVGPLVISNTDVVYAEEIELDLGTEGIQRGDFIPFETDEPAQG